MNFLIVLAAAVIPLVIGFIWYHPKVFGAKWMAAAGITDEKLKTGNMAVVFGVTFLLSMLLAFFMQFLVIHQVHFHNFLMSQPDFKNPGSEAATLMNRIDELFGSSYRTFKHGMFHGVLAGIVFIMPVLAINALFERKGFKYIAINVGYWALTLGLMGGIICQFIKL